MRNFGQSLLIVAAFLAVSIQLTPTARGADNIDPSADGHQYAWGENAGWLNAKPTTNNGISVADFTLTGWMWGENIGWVSLTCDNTSTCATTQYGILNDGSGHLSGLAWGENVGWIDFGPTTCLPDPTCGVKIDPATGYFSGRAWGENIGWVSFDSGSPQTWTARTSWCQGVAAAPGPTAGLVLQKLPQSITLSWTPADGSTWFDVVGGSLSALRASNGEFTVATKLCIGGRLAQPLLAGFALSPPLGDGFWFVVRSANCRGRGTYDSGASSQRGSRDPGIAASQRACP